MNGHRSTIPLWWKHNHKVYGKVTNGHTFVGDRPHSIVGNTYDRRETDYFGREDEGLGSDSGGFGVSH